MQRTSEFAQISTRATGASALVHGAQELAASAAAGFTGEANAKALYLGDLSALAAAELARRAPARG
jgi:hypothetical protein